MPAKNCPTHEELSTYVRGLLPESQADALTAHVADCARCEDTMQELSAATSDNLIARIQAPAAAQPYIDEEACRKVTEAVKKQAVHQDEKSDTARQNSAPLSSTPTRAMNHHEFVEILMSFGFVSAGDIAAIEKRLPAAEAGNVQALARALVQQGKLTKYQASAVYQGQGKSLVYGDYLVLDRIGAGGMGQVYKARHKRMDRIIALKVLSTAAMKNADSIRRFEREVRAAAKLNHPNIVTAHDAGLQDGVHYLVMEYVEGPDLSSLLKKQGKFPIKQACEFITQAARGFAFAHEKGIVHRDIKPGNLLLDKSGVVKVLDMGLARFDDGSLGETMGEAELTQSGAVMGTVDYMAPEQALNTSKADAKSDVYSLGCTLYRLLTGESVFGGDTIVEKILAHREQPIPQLRSARPDAPPALETLINRMLAKKPDERPTMKEIADALPGTLEPGIAVQPALTRAHAGAPAGIAAVAAQPKTKGAMPPKKGSKLPLLVAAGAGGLLILGGILFIIRDKDGNKIAEVNAPDGSSVTAQASPTPPNPPAAPSQSPTKAAPLAAVIPSATAPASSFTTPSVATTPVVTTPVDLPPTTLPPTATPSNPGSAPVAIAPSAPPRGGIPARAVAPFDAAQAKSLQAAWAAFLGQRDVVENNAGMKLVLIPAGEFQMGSTPAQQATALQTNGGADYEKQFVDTEAPQHRVVLRSAYRISATEVTIGQFRRFVEATKYKTECEEPANADPSDVGRTWHTPSYPATDQSPATCVSWNDAVAFCNWLSTLEGLTPAYRNEGPWKWSVGTTADGYRLPTEAEWEFACRAGTTTQFWYGDDFEKIPEFAATSAGAETASKPANPFGLFDMSGGVWEWCQDVYPSKPYEAGTAEDPTGATSPNPNAQRSIRGGTWRNPRITFRSAYRCGYVPKSRNHHTGFRVVKVIGATKPVATAIAATPTSGSTPNSAVVATAATSNRSSPAEILAFDFDPLPQEVAVGQSLTMEFRVTNSKSQEFPLTGTYHHSDLAAFKPVAAVQVRLQCLEPGPDALLAATDYKNAPMTAAGIVVGAPRISSTNKTLAGGETVKASMPLRISTLPAGRYVMTVVCVPTQGLGRVQYASTEFRLADQPAATPVPGNVAWSFMPPSTLASAPRLLPITDPERRAVLWALPLGAKLQIMVNGQGVGPNPLPDGPFTVRNIDFYENANNNESRHMVTDADLENLVGLKELKQLRLNYGQITDFGMKHLAGLATVTELNLSSSKVGDSGIAKLGAMKDLRSLRLNGTEVGDAGVEKIVAQFPMVSEPLELNDTKVTDVGAAHLRNHQYVRFLGLAGTDVTDECIPHLAAMPRLGGVNLIGTRVTEAGVAKLKSLMSGRTIDVGFDPAKVKTGPRPAVIATVPFASTTPIAAATPAAASPGEAPAAPAGPSRSVVPDSKAQQAALQLIKEVYKDDYTAARAPDKKTELAEKLLEQSTQTTDPTDRYVLLNEARTFALDGDDQALLRRVLTAIVTDFNVDTATVYIDSWKGVLAKPRPTTLAKGIYDDITAMFESAVAQGAFDEAKRFGDYAVTVAPRIGDATAVKSTRDRNALLVARQQEWTAARAALAKLAASPDDPEANFAVGRYRAHVEADWATALPHLAKGSDETWKDLAAKGITVAADGAARAALADAFWDASTKAKGPATKAEFAAAALYWYQAALPSLSGLQKVRIEKRLAEATAAVPAKKLPPTTLDAATAAMNVTATPTFGPGTTPSAGAAATPPPAAGIAPLAGDPRSPLGNAVYVKWLKEVAAMPAKDQVEAVSKKMIELNPGFDGKLTTNIDRDVVVSVSFLANNVVNIYPLRAFAGLRVVICGASARCQLADLTPLSGMRIDRLHCEGTAVVDLSPLRGMPLEVLSMSKSMVADLSPLAGMPLKTLNIDSTQVFDLSPLQNCKQLTSLTRVGSRVQPAMMEALKQTLPNCEIK